MPVSSRSVPTDSSQRSSPTQLRPDPRGYGGVFVAGSLLWGGVLMDGFRPDRWDIAGGALVCLVGGVGLIMYSPPLSGRGG